MAIDLCKKLNEAEGVAANVDALRASVGTLEATVARLRDEKSTLELAVAEGASRLEAERKTCAELKEHKWLAKEHAAAQQEEQTTHFAIALTGHVRSFMSDPLVATSLRLNLVQPLLRQRITP